MSEQGQKWSNQEVAILLDFFLQVRKSDGEEALHKVSSETMEELCRRLRKKGFFRTLTQVKAKWKRMKSRYSAVLTEGRGDEWESFNKMSSILSSTGDIDNDNTASPSSLESEEADGEPESQDDVLTVVKAFVEHYETRDKQFLKEMRQMNQEFLQQQEKQHQEFLKKLQSIVDDVVHNFTSNVLSRIGEVVVKSWAQNALDS